MIMMTAVTNTSTTFHLDAYKLIQTTIHAIGLPMCTDYSIIPFQLNPQQNLSVPSDGSSRRQC